MTRLAALKRCTGVSPQSNSISQVSKAEHTPNTTQTVKEYFHKDSAGPNDQSPNSTRGTFVSTEAPPISPRFRRPRSSHTSTNHSDSGKQHRSRDLKFIQGKPWQTSNEHIPGDRT